MGERTRIGQIAAEQPVVRHWISPRAGTVEISGTLRFAAAQGLEIRGRIASTAAGKLGEWMARGTNHVARLENVKVAEGDAVDFIVETHGAAARFEWSPQIKFTGKDIKPENTNPTLNWNAKSDFNRAGRDQTQPLTPWEKLCQVLLLANELAFVD